MENYKMILYILGKKLKTKNALNSFVRSFIIK